MSTILEVYPGMRVTLNDDGSITSDDYQVAQVAENVWRNEQVRHYWPDPPSNWARAMRRYYPDLRVIDVDETEPSRAGVVY